MIEKLAPIVLFVYNRPEHVRKTIMALQKNELADQSRLFIYSDGARGTDDENLVQDVRKIISDITGFAEIQITERSENVGLGRNIIDAVTKTVNQYGRVIVLEDDILTSRYFLRYMNEALDKYAQEETVMSVSGYTPPMDTGGLPETFFMSWPDCWGWGTWKRAWDKFERNPEKLVQENDSDLIRKINIDGTAPGMWKQVLDNYYGRRYTWAIFFHAAVCREHGLTLYSRCSLTSNEGMDGSGDDSGTSNLFDVSSLQAHAISFYPEKIEKCLEAERSLQTFYHKISKEQVAWKRIWNVISREGIHGICKRIKIYCRNRLGENATH